MHTRVVVYGGRPARGGGGGRCGRLAADRRHLDLRGRARHAAALDAADDVHRLAGGPSSRPGTPLGRRVLRPAGRRAFLARAYDRDLTSGSGVAESDRRARGTVRLLTARRASGRRSASPGRARSTCSGSTTTSTCAGIERALRRLGYTPPRGGSGTRRHLGRGRRPGRAGSTADLTPMQQNVVVLPDQKLVLMSDSAGYLAEAAAVAAGKADVADLSTTPAWPASPGRPTTRSPRCSGPRPSPARTSRWARPPRRTSRRASGWSRRPASVSPLEGLVMAQQPDRRLRRRDALRDLRPGVPRTSSRGSTSPPATGAGAGRLVRRPVHASPPARPTARTSCSPLTPRSRTPRALRPRPPGPVLFATC